MRKPYRERVEDRDRKRYEGMKKAGKCLMCVFLFEVAFVLFLAWSLLWDSWLELFIFVLALLLPLMLGIGIGAWIMASGRAGSVKREAMENERVLAKFVENGKGARTGYGG
jgi:fatty-acid desaturase